MKSVLSSFSLCGLLLAVLPAFGSEPILQNFYPPETPYAPTFFAINGGYHASSQTSTDNYNYYTSDSLHVCPFVTPPWGLRIRQMMFTFQNDELTTAHCSFGIYDANGQRVAWSGVVPIGAQTSEIKSVNASGYLFANRVYYLGCAYSSRFYIQRVNIPVHPQVGHIRGIAPGGLIPETFNLNQIRTSIDEPLPILPVTLILEDGTRFWNDNENEPTPIPTATPTPAPVQLFSPAGGEVFNEREYLEIHWKTDVPRAGTAVRFDLHTADGKIAELGAAWNAGGEGIEQVYLPLLPDRSDYRIRIFSSWDPRFQAESSAPFTIHGNPVRIIEPAGPETWPIGSWQRIYWQANPQLAGTSVLFELIDAQNRAISIGASWQPDGECFDPVWLPAELAPGDYHLRVSSAWQPDFHCDSVALITITAGEARSVPAQSRAAAAPAQWELYE